MLGLVLERWAEIHGGKFILNYFLMTLEFSSFYLKDTFERYLFLGNYVAAV